MMNVQKYIGSLFCLAVGVFVCIVSYRLGFGTFQEPGPGFIFSLSGLALIILSCIDLLSSFLEKPKITYREMWTELQWWKVIAVLIGLSSYAYFVESLGFFISTFLLMMFLLKVVEPTGWWMSLIGSIIVTLTFYFIFIVLLQIPFPMGYLGF